MILYTHLEKVKINTKEYNVIPQLKLTNGGNSNITQIRNLQPLKIQQLIKEAKENKFKLTFNNTTLT